MSAEAPARQSHRDDAEERLAELVLYIASKSEYDPRFGAVKLNKALFFVDFLAYTRLGRPVTGVIYRRLQHGPVPRVLPRVRDALVVAGRAVEKTTHYHGFEQRRLIGLDEANLDIFTAREIALVDEVLDIIQHKTAKELSELTHEFRGWELAEHGEDIPYSTVFLASEAPALTRDEVQLGQQLARRIG
ncbi:MAG: SocA family protein [Myxococcales bacterium]|nr:SocA family protein [Myxococcales bacterium]